MYSRKKIHEFISFSCILLLVLMWSYASIAKLADYSRFVTQMQLVPFTLLQQTAPVLAWLLPLVELALVALLWREDTRRLGCILSFGLLLAFVVYIITLLLSGLTLPCTCGGIISKLSWQGHLWFNLSFMLLSLLPVYLTKNQHRYTNKMYI